MASLFLSHNWQDRFFARKLAEVLESNGVVVWIDEAEIKIGDSIIQQVSEAIDKTDFIGIILSHNSVTSSWVQKELQIAMMRELEEKKAIVLPILLEKCQIPPFLKDKKYIDFTNPTKFKSALDQLLAAIGASKPKSKVKLREKKHKEIPGPLSQQTISILESFEDIKMVGIDKGKIYNPDTTKEMFNVYFSLSKIPPKEWGEIFNAERQFPRHKRWRHASLDGKHIIVLCPLEEIKMHSNDLVNDVSNSNNKYREDLLRRAKKEEQRKIMNDEKKKIDDAVDGIEFDWT